jgi:hypothetical protein
VIEDVETTSRPNGSDQSWLAEGLPCPVWAMDLGCHLSVFPLSSEEIGMAELAMIEMQDRELFAAMAMQALLTRVSAPADIIAK